MRIENEEFEVIFSIKKISKTISYDTNRNGKRTKNGCHAYLGVSCSAMSLSHLSCVSILIRY
jgi:hypothetical protein